MYGEKEGFESFDDQNLFLFTDLTGPNIFVRSHPRSHLPFPRLRVEGHRHLRQTSRFTTFYTFPDICLRLESIKSDPNILVYMLVLRIRQIQRETAEP
jgi:hypothetical protein